MGTSVHVVHFIIKKTQNVKMEQMRELNLVECVRIEKETNKKQNMNTVKKVQFRQTFWLEC